MKTQFIEVPGNILRGEREGQIKMDVNEIVTIDGETYHVMIGYNFDMTENTFKIHIWKNSARDKK